MSTDINLPHTLSPVLHVCETPHSATRIRDPCPLPSVYRVCREVVTEDLGSDAEPAEVVQTFLMEEKQCTSFLNALEQLAHYWNVALLPRDYRQELSTSLQKRLSISASETLAFPLSTLRSSCVLTPSILLNDKIFFFSQDLLSHTANLHKSFNSLVKHIRQSNGFIDEPSETKKKNRVSAFFCFVTSASDNKQKQLKKSLKNFDRAFRDFERLYLQEMTLIMTEARKPLLEAIEMEKQLKKMEDILAGIEEGTPRANTPSSQANKKMRRDVRVSVARTRFFQRMHRLCFILASSSRPELDPAYLEISVLVAAEEWEKIHRQQQEEEQRMASRMSSMDTQPSMHLDGSEGVAADPDSICIRVEPVGMLLQDVLAAYRQFRQVLRSYSDSLDDVSPQLTENNEIVHAIEDMHRAFKIAGRFASNAPRRNCLLAFTKMLADLLMVEDEMIREQDLAGTQDAERGPTVYDRLVEMDGELLFNLPRVLLWRWVVNQDKDCESATKHLYPTVSQDKDYLRAVELLRTRLSDFPTDTDASFLLLDAENISHSTPQEELAECMRRCAVHLQRAKATEWNELTMASISCLLRALNAAATSVNNSCC
eukprot:GILK01012059.1.p1 GENE.GILK01012059.1~~GILK01012059.1.p1  ORF type:complete len:598 (-),score=119.80 GILK01012059.1:213-2006(-)